MPVLPVAACAMRSAMSFASDPVQVMIACEMPWPKVAVRRSI